VQRAVEAVDRVDGLPIQRLLHAAAVGVVDEAARGPAADRIGLAGGVVAEPVDAVAGDIAAPVIGLIAPGEAVRSGLSSLRAA
jgi:hypothetical protein